MRSSRDWVTGLLGCWVVVACMVPRPGFPAEGPESRFSWQPSVTLGAEATDNAKLADHDGKSDLAVRVRPRVTLGYQHRNLDAGADLGVDLRRHAQVGALNKVFYRMSGHAEAGLLPGLTLRLREDYAPSPIALGAPEDHDANLVQTNRVEAGLRYWHDLDGQLELRLGVSGARFDTASVRTLRPGPARPVCRWRGAFARTTGREGAFSSLGAGSASADCSSRAETLGTEASRRCVLPAIATSPA